MNNISFAKPKGYGIDIQTLTGRVCAYRNGELLAASTNARVMYETRLTPTVYFPPQDILVTATANPTHQTFCPFKGTASYLNLSTSEEEIENAAWSYDNALPESASVRGYVGFVPETVTHFDLGENTLHAQIRENISGVLVDWLLIEAARLATPEDFTNALATKLLESGIALSRLNLMIWSLRAIAESW